MGRFGPSAAESKKYELSTGGLTCWLLAVWDSWSSTRTRSVGMLRRAAISRGSFERGEKAAVVCIGRCWCAAVVCGRCVCVCVERTGWGSPWWAGLCARARHSSHRL
jgi:hypothetical protein